jgi:predicted transposase YbfD/YdcC
MPTSKWNFGTFPPQTVPGSHSLDARHGRIEQRRLYVSDRLNDYVEWAAVGQVACLERVRIRKRTGEVLSQQGHFYVTSLDPQHATRQQLLRLCRGHWTIENKSHYVRDVVFHEDTSRVRKGTLPQVLAAFRNVTLSLLRRWGVTAVRTAFIENAAQPFRILSYLYQ